MGKRYLWASLMGCLSELLTWTCCSFSHRLDWESTSISIWSLLLSPISLPLTLCGRGCECPNRGLDRETRRGSGGRAFVEVLFLPTDAEVLPLLRRFRSMSESLEGAPEMYSQGRDATRMAEVSGGSLFMELILCWYGWRLGGVPVRTALWRTIQTRVSTQYMHHIELFLHGVTAG